MRAFERSAGRFCFNPRLPLPGGDAASVAAKASFQHCFNPRLPLPGGDAKDALREYSKSKVSIHASRCREAMPEAQRAALKLRQVSIHASRCREAMPPRPPGLPPTPKEFQSTPPVAGRRCQAAL